MAEYIGGTKEGFADVMNEKAKELGLENTHFVTPHGLDDPDHYTTALELARLTNYALNNPMFATIVGTKTYIVSINGYPNEIGNTNELLGNLDGVNGVKTGFTNNALRCLVTSVKRNSWDIITVVLGADTRKIRTKDSTTLIEYTYKNYELVDINKVAKQKFETWSEKNNEYTYVDKGIKKYAKLGMNEDMDSILPIKKEEIKDIYVNIDIDNFVEAPMPAQQVLGEVEVKLGDEVLGKYNVISIDNIDKKNTWDYFWEILSEFNLFLEDAI